MITVDVSGLEAFDNLANGIDSRIPEFLNRLAQIGMEQAQLDYVMARYDGEKDVRVTVEERGENTVAIVAAGNSVLFLEFGAGYSLGYGHPEPMDYGPGTYPGKGHWDDPNGWYLPKAVQEAIGKEKSYGNAPSMGMYNARKEIEQSLTQIAQEVFK